MTRRTFINASFLLVLILSLSACKFSYEEIIEEINASFAPEHKDTTLSELGYDTTKMIPSGTYEVYVNSVLMIEAPKGGNDYIWKVYNSQTGSEGQKIQDKTDCPNKEAPWIFYYKVPGSYFVTGERNILKLELLDPRGAVYSDEAYVYVFER